MTKLTVENVYTRHKAKELTKKHFWKLLGMMAIAFGIPFVLMTITTAFFPTSDVSTYTLVMFLLMLALQFLTIGLQLGMLRSFIDLCRGKNNVTVGSVFQHMSLCLKGYGLNLWVGLKTVLWALPIYIPVIVMALLLMDNPSLQANKSAQIIVAFLPFLALILIFALLVPAAMRYMLSTYILAHQPYTGVFDCVRESNAMMKGHKWQAFKLAVPIILAMYGILMVASVVISSAAAFVAASEALITAMGILMMIVLLGIMVYFSIRLYLCYAIFYLNRMKEMTPAEEPAEAPAESPAE